MAYNHTTTLPAGDTEQSKAILSAMIGKGDSVIIVILGDTANTEKVVGIADTRAAMKISDVERKVIWMKETSALDHLKALIIDGGSTHISDIDATKHILLAISPSKALKQILSASPLPDFVVIELAFVKASAY